MCTAASHDLTTFTLSPENKVARFSDCCWLFVFFRQKSTKKGGHFCQLFVPIVCANCLNKNNWRGKWCQLFFNCFSTKTIGTKNGATCFVKVFCEKTTKTILKSYQVGKSKWPNCVFGSPSGPDASSGDSGTGIPPGLPSTSIVPEKAARAARCSTIAIAEDAERLLRIGLYPDPGTWNVIQAPLP